MIQVWKDTRVSKLHCCHFGVNNLFYTHFSSLYTLFCPRMVLKYQICVIQAENEAVHFSQQHDKLRHSVGLKDQPWAEEGTCWQSQTRLLLLPLQQSSFWKVWNVILQLDQNLPHNHIIWNVNDCYADWRPIWLLKSSARHFMRWLSALSYWDSVPSGISCPKPLSHLHWMPLLKLNIHWEVQILCYTS